MIFESGFAFIRITLLHLGGRDAYGKSPTKILLRCIVIPRSNLIKMGSSNISNIPLGVQKDSLDSGIFLLLGLYGFSSA